LNGAHVRQVGLTQISAGSFGSPNLNPGNFQFDKGFSDFDIRNRWVTTVVYDSRSGAARDC
jgi:hypothetical protein